MKADDGRASMKAVMALALLKPTTTRTRLWQLTAALALVTLCFAAVNTVLPTEKAVTRRMLGHDFLAFYTAGDFVRTGRAAALYDLTAVAAREAEVARGSGLDIKVDLEGRKFGPWWNPPLYAWVFAPLSALPYATALAVWTTLNLLALAGAVFVLMKLLVPAADHDARGRPIDWRTTGLVPFAVLLSMPFVQAISHGQNTPGSLLILSLVAWFWRNKRAMLAGGCCAMLMYKPQLAAVVALVLVAGLGVRALVGLTFVGSGLVLLTQLTLPGTLVDYLHRMPANLRFMQIEHAYLWERHATLAGFWRLLLQGRGAGEMGTLTRALTLASVLAVGGLLARAIWSHRRAGTDDCWARLTQRSWRDRLLAAAVCCAPLVMPFYFDYDLLLLAVPAVLVAGEALVRPVEPTRFDRLLVGTWVTLYAWMLINPGMANTTGVNGTVILLTLTAVQMTLRATRPGAAARRAAKASSDRAEMARAA